TESLKRTRPWSLPRCQLSAVTRNGSDRRPGRWGGDRDAAGRDAAAAEPGVEPAEVHVAGRVPGREVGAGRLRQVGLKPGRASLELQEVVADFHLGPDQTVVVDTRVARAGEV